MSQDKTYQKQLEKFGIEAVRVTEADLNKNFLKEQREASLSTVKAIMDTMEGRRWMYEKLDLAKVFTAPFVPGQPDVSAFMSGIQAFGQILLSEIMAGSPENFYLMNQEAAARREALKPQIS